jgi:glucose dehydrogenase
MIKALFGRKRHWCSQSCLCEWHLLSLQGWVLATLGGSLYYVLSGAALTAAGVPLRLRRMEGAYLYAVFMVATIGWALWRSVSWLGAALRHRWSWAFGFCCRAHGDA